jgi:hypothetical protein
MRREGDYPCLDKLLQPAVRVNNNDLQTLRIKDAERRVQLWSEIKENLERYEMENAGNSMKMFTTAP